MVNKKLPIGIQSFEKIRGDYVYADKTEFIVNLLQKGSYYFLSRPRRFGKSLFLDTLYCLFSGRKDLFSDLYISKSDIMWDFNQTYPIIRLDFSGGSIHNSIDLIDWLDRLISRWEFKFNVEHCNGSPGERLISPIPNIFKITGKPVVILVDEYDKPILDNLDNKKIAKDLRDILRNFYGAIKPLDKYIRFVFLTGVSKFSKTGIFSGLNNIKDITLDKRYSSLCGYTQNDLITVFKKWILDYDLSKIAQWYNGYSWGGESVYNPFDILLFLDEGIYKSYWFETGTPTFLVKLLLEKPRSLPSLDTFISGEELLGSFQIEDLKPETLLFQTGYLTIKEVSYLGEKIFYKIGFPNLEVKSAFSSLMLGVLTNSLETSINQINLEKALILEDTTMLKDVFYSFFASIPHDWYRKNQISGFEGYYASVFYAYFASLGYTVIPEDTTNQGRTDLTVITTASIWIFEFEVVKSKEIFKESPLKQILEMGYAEKYKADGRAVHQIGIIFDSESRNILEWEIG